ncbi:MAG: aromatic ring-hydroxylating dioxygenase subunit alpha [Myxococcales bacterium]|nr:aromatic ring-hydroxylating dioxygenase subunit alpha [Myxococcales bacterium]HIK84241.1 aromatic ring-hydroxylating dioxygenase subunit alpha [Myxococcales bacterium]
MERTEQLRVLKQVISHLDEGTTVDAGGIRHNPTWVYTCPELAEKEWQTFYRDTPQIIGATSDLPEPDSFLTTNDFGTPVLATRDAKGNFRAFVNVCRHRGVLLEEETQGKRSKFACPFHAWTYTNEGKLAGIPKPDHFGKIDFDSHGLVPLPAVERFGLLWVHPKPEGTINLDALLGGLVPEFEAWHWEGLVNFGHDFYDMRMNWKLANDTFGETYHFNALHRNTLAQNFHGHVQAYDTYGRNHRMTLVRREIDEMRKQPEETWEITQGTSPNYFLFPNIQINVTPFGLLLFRTYPRPGDPARSFSRVGFYARPELLKEFGEMIANITQVLADVIRDEDYAVAARSQIGADAGVPDHNVFGRNEPALHHYHNTYRRVLGMEPLELLPG